MLARLTFVATVLPLLATVSRYTQTRKLGCEDRKDSWMESETGRAVLARMVGVLVLVDSSSIMSCYSGDEMVKV